MRFMELILNKDIIRRSSHPYYNSAIMKYWEVKYCILDWRDYCVSCQFFVLFLYHCYQYTLTSFLVLVISYIFSKQSFFKSIYASMWLVKNEKGFDRRLVISFLPTKLKGTLSLHSVCLSVCEAVSLAFQFFTFFLHSLRCRFDIWRVVLLWQVEDQVQSLFQSDDYLQSYGLLT